MLKVERIAAVSFQVCRFETMWRKAMYSSEVHDGLDIYIYSHAHTLFFVSPKSSANRALCCEVISQPFWPAYMNAERFEKAKKLKSLEPPKEVGGASLCIFDLMELGNFSFQNPSIWEVSIGFSNQTEPNGTQPTLGPEAVHYRRHRIGSRGSGCSLSPWSDGGRGHLLQLHLRRRARAFEAWTMDVDPIVQLKNLGDFDFLFGWVFECQIIFFGRIP